MCDKGEYIDRIRHVFCKTCHLTVDIFFAIITSASFVPRLYNVLRLQSSIYRSAIYLNNSVHTYVISVVNTFLKRWLHYHPTILGVLGVQVSLDIHNPSDRNKKELRVVCVTVLGNRPS